jgi:hypothetical protein
MRDKIDFDYEEEDVSPSKKKRLLNTIRVPKDMGMISERLPKPQYHINEVTWIKDSSSALLPLLEENTKTNSLLQPGNAYRLSDITAERERLDAITKTKGY